MTDVKIYVATHKRYDYLLKIPYDYYIPIHCGKDIYVEENNGKYLPELGDNTGENISKKNPYYCELTGLYWIWKNDKSKPDDIVGLNHYRRYFSEECEKADKFLTKETILEWMKDWDFIVNGCDTQTDNTASDDESVYNAYKGCHVINDLDITLEGIKKLFPQISDKLVHEVMHSGAMCLCNLFITKKKFLDEYCEFLFPTFEYVESRIDLNDTEHQGYNQRVFGFLAERLFRPWLKATGHTGKVGPALKWEEYSGYEWE